MDTTLDTTLREMRERVIEAHEERRPLRLRGAGTKDFYGETLEGDDDAKVRRTREPFAAGGSAGASPGLYGGAAERAGSQLLDLRPYHGIVDYEPSELVITARCGTPLSEIETALAERGQFLAFEPPAFGGGDPTIGGVVAAGLSGPRRMYAGAARDFVLGATLLDARGDLLRFGGQVMKNVAGFDVSRLLCGSLGILGIITEVSLKVLPQPRAEETLCFELPAREAIGSFNRWSGQPLPISGAAWSRGIAYLRLSGAASAVRAASERLGGERLDPTQAAQWWNSLRHCSHPIFDNNSIWRLSLPDTTPLLDLAGDVLIDWGGALRWYGNDLGDSDSRADTFSNEGVRNTDAANNSATANTADAVSRPRDLAAAAGGSAIRWRGPTPPTGRFHPLQPAVATLHRRLKDRFDPHGIFNPGRLIAGL